MSEHCEMCENSVFRDECSGWSAEDFAPNWSEYPWYEIRWGYTALTTGGYVGIPQTVLADLLGALGDAFPELRSE